MGLSPYNSWSRERPLKCTCAFVPVSMVPDVGIQGAPRHTVQKGWFMMPTSSVRYAILITIITQKAAANCVSRQGLRNVEGGFDPHVNPD